MSPVVKDALLKLGTSAWKMLHEFLTSKKVLVAVLTFIATILTEDVEKRKQIVEIGLILMGAMGVTDLGKTAAITKANADVKIETNKDEAFKLANKGKL